MSEQTDPTVDTRAEETSPAADPTSIEPVAEVANETAQAIEEAVAETERTGEDLIVSPIQEDATAPDALAEGLEEELVKPSVLDPIEDAPQGTVSYNPLTQQFESDALQTAQEEEVPVDPHLNQTWNEGAQLWQPSVLMPEDPPLAPPTGKRWDVNSQQWV